MERQVFGEYTAVRGKLDREDSRSAYVIGPCSDGTLRPIASFWNYEEAVQRAKEWCARDWELQEVVRRTKEGEVK